MKFTVLAGLLGVTLAQCENDETKLSRTTYQGMKSHLDKKLAEKTDEVIKYENNLKNL